VKTKRRLKGTEPSEQCGRKRRIGEEEGDESIKGRTTKQKGVGGTKPSKTRGSFSREQSRAGKKVTHSRGGRQPLKRVARGQGERTVNPNNVGHAPCGERAPLRKQEITGVRERGSGGGSGVKNTSADL